MQGANSTALAAALVAPQQQLTSVTDIRPDATPWGPVAAVLLCLLPILFLLATTLLRPLLLPSNASLPLAAALLALVHLVYLSSQPLLVLAHVVVGSLEGLVPLSVIFGAVLLFEAMAATGCLQFLMANVRCLSAGSPIAEVFLIAWAFAYTISGVGGFATPMALAAPMLVSLGHDPLMSLVAVVGLNGLAAHLGSVGMAVVFGFKSLGLSHTQVLRIGLKSAAVVGACSVVIAPAAASFLVSWRDLLCNAGFVFLSIASAVVPTVLFAMISPEFPLVAGGLISLLVTWLLVKYGIGLRPPCIDQAGCDLETGGIKPSAAPAGATQAALGQPSACAAAGGLSSLRPIVVTAVTTASYPPQPDSPFCGTTSASRNTTGSQSVSSSGRHATVVAAQTPHRDAASSTEEDGTRMVSPFEIYSRHPLTSGGTAAAPAQQPTPHSPHAALIARRSRSLVAAAAAVGAITPHAAAAEDVAAPGCIFRCPSCCAAEEVLVVEAALQQQQQQQPGGSHASVLPALSLVNHTTGDHIVITGQDKLSGALRLLLPNRPLDHQDSAVKPAAAPLSVTAALPAPQQQQLQQRMSEASPLPPAWRVGDAQPAGPVRCLQAALRTLPIWLTVLLLLVTHVPALKLQDILRRTTPSLTAHLGTLGSLSLSPALVLQLQDVFTQGGADFKVELLNVPCLIPFVLVSCITLALFRRDLQASGVGWRAPFATAWHKLAGTVPAMLGALVLAQLMSAGGSRSSPAFIIAFYLTTWLGRGYLGVAGFMGALGSFVSGSVMGSNMTQGAIQAVAAQRLSVPVTGLLAVQVAGACAGKMVCLSSILSAKVVLTELDGVSESEVVRRTGPLALLYVVLAQLLGLLWTAGGLWPDVTSTAAA